MNFTGPSDDRLAIHELIYSFSDASTREDHELWASCWADDALWITDKGEHRGKQEIINHWKSLNEAIHNAEGILYRVNMGYPAAINVDGGVATGRTYFFVLTYLADSNTPRFFVGLYQDEFCRIDGNWLFKSRVFQSVASSQVTKHHINFR
jgi:hypothetical protein